MDYQDLNCLNVLSLFARSHLICCFLVNIVLNRAVWRHHHHSRWWRQRRRRRLENSTDFDSRTLHVNVNARVRCKFLILISRFERKCYRAWRQKSAVFLSLVLYFRSIVRVATMTLTLFRHSAIRLAVSKFSHKFSQLTQKWKQRKHAHLTTCWLAHCVCVCNVHHFCQNLQWSQNRFALKSYLSTR